jgi:hypothetical protein
LGAPVLVVGGSAVVGDDAEDPDDEHALSNSTRASGVHRRLRDHTASLMVFSVVAPAERSRAPGCA